MALSIEYVNNLQVVKSVGKLKSYDAFLAFKIELENILLKMADKELILYFVQAYPINSYVLGYLCKLKNEDNMQVEIIVDDLRLFKFFEDIDLSEAFNVKVMEE